MNIWDILIVVLIAAALFWAVRSLRDPKKHGCSGCCAACPHACAAGKREMHK